MTRTRALAVAQTTPCPGDVPANVAQHVELARVAGSAGARILVFPELSLTGYELELAAELAFSERDTRLEPLIALSAAIDLTLIVGAPLRLGRALHLAAFAIAPDGSIELHTKQRLGTFPAAANPHGPVPPAERTVFEPGERQPLLHVGDDVAALAICAETGAAHHVATAAANGATCYLASMFAIPSELARDAERLSGYAARHSLAVALANFGGTTGGLEAGGGSAIWSERGELLVQLDRAGTGVAVALQVGADWRTERHELAS